MVFNIGYITARAGCETLIEQAVREVLPPTREEEGCLLVEICRAHDEPRKFYVISQWRDEAALTFHQSTPHVARFFTACEEGAEDVQLQLCSAVHS